MTQEDKDLLLRDLCGRLPYGVICRTRKEYSSDCDFVDKVPFIGILIDVCYDVKKVTLKSTPLTIRENYDFSVEEIIPYLRPMSSMTEEEREEWADLFMKPICELEQYIDEKEAQDMAPVLFGKSHSISTDWLLSKGFDVRGLIPKGLALEASEDMYK